MSGWTIQHTKTRQHVCSETELSHKKAWFFDTRKEAEEYLEKLKNKEEFEIVYTVKILSPEGD